MIRVVKEGDYYDATGCLIALRQMIEEWGLGYLTAEERVELKTLVALFLLPDTPMIRSDWDDVSKTIIVKYAAHLALVLDDAEARGWVELLAMNAEAYQEKTGTPYPEFNKNDLQEVLTGGSLLPKTTPLSEYLESWKGGYGLVDRRQ